MADVLEKDRVTVRMSGELGKYVREIIEHTPANTPTDVVRRALMTYHTLMRARLNGEDLARLSEDEDGKKVMRPIFL